MIGAASVLLALLSTASVAAPPFQELAKKTIGADQPVYVVAEDGTVLADLNSSKAVHPASVTKLVSTYVLLRELGPEHRFATRAIATGPVEDGTLEGDLVIQSEGDPFLVSESALLLLTELRRLGIQRVDGRLRIEGDLVFNWKPDPSGKALGAVLAGRVDDTAWRKISAQRSDLDGRSPGSLGLRFAGGTSGGSDETVLLTHRSPSMQRILKELNGYSNNIFHLLSDQVGGPGAVERAARSKVPVEMQDEILITNAAGAGTTNRLSPRATVELIGALQAESSRRGLELTDLLPVAGFDRGTLQDRFSDPDLRGAVVGKTGTYGSLGACALAGVARTRKYGEIRFAILNKDVPVPEARRRQDAFLEALLREAGPVPWSYSAPDSPILEEERLEVGTPVVQQQKRPPRHG